MPATVSAAHAVPAPVPRAFAALTGPDWAPALAARLSDGSSLVERTDTPDGGVHLVVSRRLPEGVPSVLQRFVPAGGTVLQTDTWGPERDGVRTGTWSVDLAGAPGGVGGVMRLEPAGEGARWVLDGTVTVRVPLVGGKVEAYLAPLLEKLVATQAEVLRSLV